MIIVKGKEIPNNPTILLNVLKEISWGSAGVLKFAAMDQIFVCFSFFRYIDLK